MYSVHTSELRDVACNMGSHSATSDQTQVNVPVPCRTTPSEAGTLLTYPATPKGWKAELT